MSHIATPPIAIEPTFDLVTPPLAMPPGRAIAGYNYEPVTRGFRRCDGYERYDGQPAPSAQTYHIINFGTGTANVTATSTVTGATSGATGIAVVDSVVSSGTFGGGNAVGYLVLRQVTGTFQSGENLQVAAVTKCVSTSVASERAAANDTLDATYLQAAIEAARLLIAKPTGSGSIRGTWIYAGNRYCFRDNAGATAGGMWKATTTGWVAVDLGRSLPFTAGGGGSAYTIAEGDVLTGAISGATATVKRVIVDSGSFALNTAVGRLIIYTQVGNFQAENVNVGAHAPAATIAANSTAQTLAAGGKYQFINRNFFGAASARRMYGANGVNKGFEFDGSTFVLIATGMVADTPTRVGYQKNNLIFTFTNGSVQSSGTGLPYTWTAITGAAEIGIGTEVTDIVTGYKSSMPIFGQDKISALYGTSSTDYVLDDVNSDTGAFPFTAQLISDVVYLDNAGLRNFSATQDWGNWQVGTISRLIEPIFKNKRDGLITPVCSMRVRGKSQYRLFYSDKTVVVVYFGRMIGAASATSQAAGLGFAGLPCMSFFNLAHQITTCCSGDDGNGNEVLLFGDDTGMVYQMDAGTSFDGAAVLAWLRLAFTDLKTPTQNKVWKNIILNCDAAPTTMLYLSAVLGDGDPDLPSIGETPFLVSGGGGIWNQSNWNQFYWSSRYLGRAHAWIGGKGTNISCSILSQATYEQPHTIHGISYHYTKRGLVKG